MYFHGTVRMLTFLTEKQVQQTTALDFYSVGNYIKSLELPLVLRRFPTAVKSATTISLLACNLCR
jgi:hypothetical protein